MGYNTPFHGEWSNNGVTYLLSSNWILGDPPPVAETIRQFEDGQNKLALGCPPFLQPRLQSEMLNVGGVGCCCREEANSRGYVRFTSPSVPGH